MIRTDPRTKVALLLLSVVFSIFIPTDARLVIWIGLITIYGVLMGRVKKTIRAAIVFAALFVFARYGLSYLTGTLHTSLLVWLGLVFKCYPSCMLAGVVTGTTHISEFMAAMAKMKVPREIVIPIAIMFRYFPVVGEDWRYIVDAMALRGISFKPAYFFRNPVVVLDALYVPMLITASKAADELSIAAITRGIENPRQRTSRLDIHFSVWDTVVFLCFLGALVIMMIGK